MRRRLTWIGFGILLAYVVGAGLVFAFATVRDWLDPPIEVLSAEFRQVVRWEGFVDETRVRELQFEIIDLKESHREELEEVRKTKIVGRVEIREVPVEIPGPTVVEYVDRPEFIQPIGPAPCEIERMSLGGTCTTEVIEAPEVRLARVFWSGQAAWSIGGRPGTSSRGPVLADEITFESEPPPKPMRWWPLLEARVGVHSGGGWEIGATYSPLHRRAFWGRLGLWAAYQSRGEEQVYDFSQDRERLLEGSRVAGGLAVRW